MFLLIKKILPKKIFFCYLTNFRQIWKSHFRLKHLRQNPAVLKNKRQSTPLKPVRAEAASVNVHDRIRTCNLTVRSRERYRCATWTCVYIIVKQLTYATPCYYCIELQKWNEFFLSWENLRSHHFKRCSQTDPTSLKAVIQCKSYLTKNYVEKFYLPQPKVQNP